MFADARQKFIERAVPTEISGVEDVSARVGSMTIDGKARAYAALSCPHALLGES